MVGKEGVQLMVQWVEKRVVQVIVQWVGKREGRSAERWQHSGHSWDNDRLANRVVRMVLMGHGSGE